MNRLDDILIKIQKLCERAQRHLQDAAADGDFDEVASIAIVAKQLAQIAHRPSRLEKPSSVARSARASKSLVVDDAGSSHHSADVSHFPRFTSDDGSLVKLGCSPRNNSIYRHRVEDTALQSILRAIVASASESRMFKVADVSEQAECESIPSYQLTTTFAWLKHSGLIAHHGKRGYSLAKPRAFMSEAKTAFELLPTDDPSTQTVTESPKS